MLDKVDLLAAARLLTTAWAPETVAAFNGNHVQVVRVEDRFVWHQHVNSDNLFLALDHPVLIELRERTVQLERGEVFVVPAGVEHRLSAEGTAHVMCLEHLGEGGTGEARRTLEAEPEAEAEAEAGLRFER